MPRFKRAQRARVARCRQMHVEQLEDRSLLAAILFENHALSFGTLAVEPNNPPSGSDRAIAMLEDSVRTISAADFDFSDPLDSPGHALKAVRIVELPATGMLRVGPDPVLAGQFVSADAIASGSLRYTPPPNASGSPLARITFQVQDDGGTEEGGVDLDPTPNTLTINVTRVNDPPSGGDFALTVFEDSLYGFGVGDFRYSDSLDAPPNVFTNLIVESAPTGLLLDGQQVSDDQVIEVSSIAARKLRYVAPANLSGEAAARIVFTVQDNGGTENGGSDVDPTPNTLTINIPGVNDAPVGGDSQITTPEDATYFFALEDFPFSDPFDSPPNKLAALWITSLPQSGQLLLGTAPVGTGQVVAASAVDTGMLRYVPPPNAFGDSLASFSFQVADDGGVTNGGEFLDPTAHVMTIHVTAVNDPPVANDDSRLVGENGILDETAPGVMVNDADIDLGDTRQVSAVEGSAAAVGSSIVLPSGAILLVQANGSFRYDPNSRFEHLRQQQLATDSFSYEIRDAGGLTATARVNIAIVGVNDAPTAANDQFTLAEEELFFIAAPGVLRNDADVDGPSLVSEMVDPPLHGQFLLRSDGAFTYQPKPDYHGPDQFTYRASDGQTASDIVTVFLTVTNVNDAPHVVLPSTLSGSEGSLLTIAGSFSDADPSDSWTATVDFGFGPEPLGLAADKTFSTSRAFPDNGVFPVTVSVRDAAGLVGSAVVIVTVTNVAPQNVSLNGPASVNRGEAVTLVGSFNDPGLSDSFTAIVDWGDGSTTTIPASQLASSVPFSFSHTYVAAGSYPVRLQVLDDDGGQSAAPLRNVTVVSNSPGASVRGGVLEITGSARGDNVAVSLSRGKVVVNGTYGGSRRNQSFNQANVQRIVARLDGGNDTLKVDAKIRAMLIVDAGAGNDRITAGGGASLLLGGNGSDLLYGGSGRDVLIGGSGKDQLWGYGGSDLLISGSTTFNANQQALAAILAEWASSRGFRIRGDNLAAGTGPVLSGTGVSLVAGTTVLEDTEVDSLMGNGDSDWFFANPRRDKLNDAAERQN